MIDTSHAIYEGAMLLHKPIKVFALFSGGNDSIVSTHFAMEKGADSVVHINTGIGIRETREFVRDTCNRYGWPLIEEFPPDKTYEQFVLKYGFPGPAAHRYAYVWLKERALNKIIRENKKSRKDRIALVTGVRNQESARRMGYTNPILRVGSSVWVAPIYMYSKIDLHKYRTTHSLPQSEVSRKLGMSGECLCGAFASPSEFQLIWKNYPEAAIQISDLEDKVKAAGIPRCIWGDRSYKAPISIKDDSFMPMCIGCNESKRRENLG
ncbi:MAG TPA: phosphoadenosine phosphosulfate reductase family protein [Bacteroidia bacterium]|jgi:3'-phosphoadenosine 5'-phosphosulfate sulfotransferase (PAPS reductase)/FAD synthetase|nr:phosphoadenosine phosphosulfate reductase family protein [Bacteroidia bacterium]